MLKRVLLFFDLLSKNNKIKINNKNFKDCVILSKETEIPVASYNYYTIKSSDYFDYLF